MYTCYEYAVYVYMIGIRDICIHDMNTWDMYTWNEYVAHVYLIRGICIPDINMRYKYKWYEYVEYVYMIWLRVICAPSVNMGICILGMNTWTMYNGHGCDVFLDAYDPRRLWFTDMVDMNVHIRYVL